MGRAIIGSMKANKKITQSARTTAKTIRSRIEASGERVWRIIDFEGLPFTAVAQTLSRLTRMGVIQRLGKGLYFHSRQTAFGPSKPNPNVIRSLPIRQKGVFPAGIGAANMLGFTTQNPARVELATIGSSLPRIIVGKDTIIHIRRPDAWKELSDSDAAILDLLRNRGDTSELSPEDTVTKLLEYCRETGRIGRLLKAAPSEPPRVRAMLGAIGEQLGLPESKLAKLRQSLNPLSRFDFGLFDSLEYAGSWQAKGSKSRAPV